MTALIEALLLPDTAEDRQKRIRRALFWYAVLPQLILRNTNQNIERTSKILTQRCNQFLNHEFGILLNRWEHDRKKALARKRKQIIQDPDTRLKVAVKMIKSSEPKCIQRAVSIILSYGVGSCDRPEIKDQMISKFPRSDDTWLPHIPAGDGSDDIQLKGISDLLDKQDFYVGTGPRGLHAHHLHLIRRAVTTSELELNGTEIFERLGTLILSNKVPWVTLALSGALLSPLFKKSEGSDCRPALPQDRDFCNWCQGAQRQYTDLTREQVAPQQVAVGVSGGVEIVSHGINETLDEANRHNTPLVIVAEDGVNCHNEFNRKALVRDVREMAESNPDMRALAHLISNICDIEPQVYARSTMDPTGIQKLTTLQVGGAQGNAVTNIAFPISIDKPLKEAERNFPGVIIRAVQDDITILGDPTQIFGPNNVREQLQADLQARGYKFHPTKKFAYGRTVEDRSIIPAEYIQDFREVQDPATGEIDRVYGIVIHGVPHGHKDYVKCWLREKGESLAEEIDKISASISTIDPHCGYVTSYYSLQEMGNFIMATSSPSLTKEFATIVDSAIQRSFSRNIGFDLLNPFSLQPNNAPALKDPQFLRQRALLRASRGGVGIRLLNSGSAFLNSMCNCAPQFIDRRDEFGNIVKSGFFQNLSTVFGVDSFNVGRENQRWSSYLQSGSSTALEFKAMYEMMKREQNMINIILPENKQIDDENNIFSTPIEGFASDTRKVSRRIRDQHQHLIFEDMRLRAAELPTDDPRRMAFFANSKDKIANKIFGQLPCKTVHFTTQEWFITTALHLGAPIPLLHSSLGQKIQNHPNCPQLTVDPYGHNLLTVAGISGGGTYLNHNTVTGMISRSLKEAGISHKGSSRDNSAKNVFGLASNITPANRNKKNSIFPDMLITGTVHTTNSPLAGSSWICDTKTIAPGIRYMNSSTEFAVTAERRQHEVNTEYLNNSRKLDRQQHNTPVGTRGPHEQVILNNGGRVLGFISGAFGEVSSDIHSIRDVVAQEVAHFHREFFHCNEKTAIAMFREITNRKWSHTMARSWARLLLDRLREYVGQGRRGRGGEGFQDDDYYAHETNNFHNPPGGNRGSSHESGQREGA